MFWQEFYDATLKLTETREVKFNVGVMGDSYDLEEILVANGVIYAFVSHWNKGAGENTLSIKELTHDGDLKEIQELESISALKMGNSGMYSFAVSADQSKLLILSELPFEKNTNEKIRLTCYELPSMQRLWQHQEELGWESRRAANNEISVDNQGGAYLFKRIWEKPQWVYELYAYDGKALKKDPLLALQGKELTDYKATFNQSN